MGQVWPTLCWFYTENLITQKEKKMWKKRESRNSNESASPLSLAFGLELANIDCSLLQDDNEDLRPSRCERSFMQLESVDESQFPGIGSVFPCKKFSITNSGRVDMTHRRRWLSFCTRMWNRSNFPSNTIYDVIKSVPRSSDFCVTIFSTFTQVMMIFAENYTSNFSVVCFCCEKNHRRRCQSRHH